MNKIEYESFEAFDRSFHVFVRGIDSHLENDVHDVDMIMDSLMFMSQTYHDLLESHRPEDEDKEIRDFAASVCDEHCKKVESATDQKELDSFCKDCPINSLMKGRCYA